MQRCRRAAHRTGFGDAPADGPRSSDPARRRIARHRPAAEGRLPTSSCSRWRIMHRRHRPRNRSVFGVGRQLPYKTASAAPTAMARAAPWSVAGLLLRARLVVEVPTAEPESGGARPLWSPGHGSGRRLDGRDGGPPVSGWLGAVPAMRRVASLTSLTASDPPACGGGGPRRIRARRPADPRLADSDASRPCAADRSRSIAELLNRSTTPAQVVRYVRPRLAGHCCGRGPGRSHVSEEERPLWSAEHSTVRPCWDARCRRAAGRPAGGVRLWDRLMSVGKRLLEARRRTGGTHERRQTGSWITEPSPGARSAGCVTSTSRRRCSTSACPSPRHGRLRPPDIFTPGGSARERRSACILRAEQGVGVGGWGLGILFLADP
jgi:hypothetical protein